MKVSRIILSLAIVIGVVATTSLPVSAATYGGGNVQGYAADSALDNGTIVQLDSKNGNTVKVSTQAQLDNMFGVTVDRTQLLVSSSNDALKNEVFVAVSGTYNVLVSTEAGPIVVGDYITLSSLNGVGMKAGTDEKTVFGRAASAFDGKGVTVGTTTLKDTTGKTTKTVALGLIPVTVNIQHNPNEKTTKVDVPPFLERIGVAIAEKQVSPIRIYLSMAITAISIISAIAILYSGVRSGVISIGRNPMSKRSIFRALLQIILTSILILIIGLFAVYLLLKL
ncbi:MAG: rane protein of unknown function [Candidatus Saccharibacteria bacterium]|nr:rane protein of unknown function [Candidatus Saccharibacteria bacterium]